MSISRDFRIEQALGDIRSLVAFFDFITNPKDYAAVVEQARVILDDMNKAIAIFPTVEEANVYLATSKQRVEEANAEAVNIVKAAKAQAGKQLEVVAESEKALRILTSEKNALSAQLGVRETNVKVREHTVQLQAEELNVAKEELAVLAKQLAEQKADLQSKANAVKSLLG